MNFSLIRSHQSESHCDIMMLLFLSFYKIKVLNWKLFWSTEQQEDEDDPAFVKTELSVPRAHTVIVEELLNQIFGEAEDIDGGGRKYARLQTSNGAAEAGMLMKVK